jgi:hypothetical protein
MVGGEQKGSYLEGIGSSYEKEKRKEGSPR